MPRLSDTIARLAAQRTGSITTAEHHDTLVFEPNPGALTARTYIPAGLKTGAPLVVVLHGCTQTAASYDRGTGWSTLADRAGFALLFPEQGRGNNGNLCFNWFDPGDIRRGGGEVASIAAMITTMVVAHKCDASRVFITGLSAGGAMAAAMLATYPELFAAGAIIGGMPFGCASTVGEALAQMRGQSHRSVIPPVAKAAGSDKGRRPALSVWQGDADHTVAPVNADRLVEQWLRANDIAAPPAIEYGKRWTHRTWRGADGGAAVGEWRIKGMGHGVPIDPNGPDGLGASGPYMLDVGIASTAIIARAWGIAGAAALGGTPPAEKPRAATPHAKTGVLAVIEQALKTAGLTR